MDEIASLAELILGQIADAVIYADHAGVIRRWNGAAESLFGHSPEEALGQSLDLIIPEHLRASHWRGFGSCPNHILTNLLDETWRASGGPMLRSDCRHGC